jgi:phosphotransferase system HPr (HPr) family protein
MMMRNNKEGRESRGTVMIAPRGLGERAVIAVLDSAQRFKSDILLCVGSLCIDAKSSLMALMLLGALNGQLLEVTARGVDSELAVHSITKIIHGM